MATMSTYLANKILGHVYGGVPYTAPATVYLAAMTAAPTIAGGGTEATGGSYARVAITWAAAASSQIANSAATTFPTATASWGTIVDAAIYDAATGGNLMQFNTLTTPETIATTNVLNFPIGAVVPGIA